MDNAEIIELAREAIMMTIRLGAPVMLVGLVVGVAIALLQALTQIQEMTLVFVPKIIAIFAAIFFMLPAFAASLIAFTLTLADRIVGIG